ncbi:MAG: hypothetical protein WBG44_00675 [Comamonas sp.]
MKSTTLLACTLALAALGSDPLRAGDRSDDHEKRPDATAQTAQTDGFDHDMKAVVHTAADGEHGWGWQYFCDPVHARAVVISPDGQYYLSRGKGLRWVAGVQS